MRRPVANPRPPWDRNQGQKRKRFILRSAVLVKRGDTIERVAVTYPEHSAAAVLTFADGTQIELYPVQ